jgi:hypothetical protein
MLVVFRIRSTSLVLTSLGLAWLLAASPPVACLAAAAPVPVVLVDASFLPVSPLPVSPLLVAFLHTLLAISRALVLVFAVTFRSLQRQALLFYANLIIYSRLWIASGTGANWY